MWDFVDCPPVFTAINGSFDANYPDFNSLPFPPSLTPHWHTTCTLSGQRSTRLASRGGRNRSSTRFMALGCQLRKRGFAPAPFSKLQQLDLFGCVTEVVLQILESGLKGGLEPPFFLLPRPSYLLILECGGLTPLFGLSPISRNPFAVTSTPSALLRYPLNRPAANEHHKKGGVRPRRA